MLNHLSWGANDGGQRRLLQPFRRAGRGAEELRGRGAEVRRTAELRGVAAQG